MMRLRHGMGMGMGYMGLPAPPVSQQGFTTPLSASAAAHVAASPGLNSDGVQSSNDTPPHTPPTVKPPGGPGGLASAATPGSLAGQFGGFNGLHNGYSQSSPSPNVSLGGAVGGGDSSSMSNYSKVLMFNSSMNNTSSFKMM